MRTAYFSRHTFQVLALLASILALPDMGSAAILSGVVRDPAGLGVGGVDLDILDAATGMKISTANDTTDPDGTFDIVVPVGLYHVVFNVPQVKRLVSLRIRNIDIVEPSTDVGDIPLVSGVRLAGRVARASNGSFVFDADLDVDDSFTGDRVITPDDNSDAAGNFSVIVPLGVHDITVEPSLSDILVSERVLAVSVTGDMDLGTISLQGGFLVSGTVTQGGPPIEGVEVDAFSSIDGGRIPTPGGDSNNVGFYSIVLPVGDHTVKASPPLGSGRAHVLLLGVMVSGPTNLDIDLPSTPISVAVGSTGSVVDRGGFFRPEVFLLNNTAGPVEIRAIVAVTLPRSGATSEVLPPVQRMIPPTVFPLSGIARIRIPANLNPRLLGLPLHFVTTVLDPSSGQVRDTDRIEFRIR